MYKRVNIHKHVIIHEICSYNFLSFAKLLFSVIEIIIWKH